MRILLAHNAYQQPGGEDVVYRNEIVLLRRHGHEVLEYLDDNRRIPELGSLQLAKDTVWSNGSYRRLSEVLEKFPADVVHFHNTFPLISPSAYYAARRRRVPIVQTLHNYRLVCPDALLLREGRPCEDCLGKTFAWPGVVHACYRSSVRASLAVAGMLAAHRVLGTWQKMVDVYVALSEFARGKFIAGGLPADRIAVRPNYLLDDSGPGDGAGGYALCVGRLSHEKGISVLLSAWEQMQRNIPLTIVGEGDERRSVGEATQRMNHVTWLGTRPRDEVLSLMRQARVLILPSICYENFPVVVPEAYASGLPVIGSRIGCLPEIVRNGETGLLFRAGDPGDLVDTVYRLWDRNDLMAMRRRVRSEFEDKYSSDLSYLALLNIYRIAISHAQSRDVLRTSIEGPRIETPHIKPASSDIQ